MINIKDYGQQLEQTDIKQTYRQVKNWTLILFIVGYGLLGPAYIVNQKGSFWWLSFNYFFTFLTIGAGVLWCLFDSAVNDYPFGQRMLFLMILVFPICYIPPKITRLEKGYNYFIEGYSVLDVLVAVIRYLCGSNFEIIGTPFKIVCRSGRAMRSLTTL